MARESDGQASLRPLRSDTGEVIQMAESEPTEFDAAKFLAKAGLGRRMSSQTEAALFSQGSPADSVFYLQKGRVRLTVVSKRERSYHRTARRRRLHRWGVDGRSGRPANGDGDGHYACTALKIERAEMIRVMHEEHAFSDSSWSFCSPAACESRPIWSISFSTPAKSGLARIRCWWPSSASRANQRRWSQDHAGNAGGNDRHHPVPRQLLHEPLPQDGIHRLQRPHPGSQVAAQGDPAWPTTRPERRKTTHYDHATGSADPQEAWQACSIVSRHVQQRLRGRVPAGARHAAVRAARLRPARAHHVPHADEAAVRAPAGAPADPPGHRDRRGRTVQPILARGHGDFAVELATPLTLRAIAMAVGLTDDAQRQIRALTSNLWEHLPKDRDPSLACWRISQTGPSAYRLELVTNSHRSEALRGLDANSAVRLHHRVDVRGVQQRDAARHALAGGQHEQAVPAGAGQAFLADPGQGRQEVVLGEPVDVVGVAGQRRAVSGGPTHAGRGRSHRPFGIKRSSIERAVASPIGRGASEYGDGRRVAAGAWHPLRILPVLGGVRPGQPDPAGENGRSRPGSRDCGSPITSTRGSTSRGTQASSGPWSGRSRKSPPCQLVAALLWICIMS